MPDPSYERLVDANNLSRTPRRWWGLLGQAGASLVPTEWWVCFPSVLVCPLRERADAERMLTPDAIKATKALAMSTLRMRRGFRNLL
jgi:hypothetical protein